MRRTKKCSCDTSFTSKYSETVDSLAPSNTRKPVGVADVRNKQDVGLFSFIIRVPTLCCQATDSMMTTSFSRVIKYTETCLLHKKSRKIKAHDNTRKLIDHLELA